MDIADAACSLKLKEMYQMITLGGDAELELVDTLDPFSEVRSSCCHMHACAYARLGCRASKIWPNSAGHDLLISGALIMHAWLAAHTV